MDHSRITNTTVYGSYICGMVNSKEITNLDNHVQIVDMTNSGRDKPLEKVGKTKKFIYEGQFLSHPTITFTPKNDCRDTLVEIYQTLFVDHRIEIDYFDKDQSKVIRRVISESDVVVSGSSLTTILYDVVNTATGEMMKSNDIDVYILPHVRKLYVNGKLIGGGFKQVNNIVVDGKNYQIISISAEVPKNVYGFYDFDICRGMIQFTNDGMAIITLSQMMMDCISSGYAVVGFHTIDARIKKYQDRGLGVFLIPGTKIVDTTRYYGAIRGGNRYSIRGFNAVRSARCMMCGTHHLDNREKIHLYQGICKTCLAKEKFSLISVGDSELFNDNDNYSQNIVYDDIITKDGTEVWYSGKNGRYHLIVPSGAAETRFGHMVYKYAGVLKHPGKCHKVTFPIINVAKTSDATRKTILRYLGIDEVTFRTGRYTLSTRKYKLLFPMSDPMFYHYSSILERYQKHIIQKARAYHDETTNELCIKVSLYIPVNDELLNMLVGGISELSNCKYTCKPYTPFVTGNRYKLFPEWAKPVTKRTTRVAKKVVPKKVVCNTNKDEKTLSQILSEKAAADIDLLASEIESVEDYDCDYVSDSGDELVEDKE